jgi:DDE family transposase
VSGLENTLLSIVEPHTAGDPMNAKKWLNCRLRDIQEQLAQYAMQVSLPVISRLLKAHDYRLRVNHKTFEGEAQPERDRQFTHIQAQREAHRRDGQPCLSVDTKKKELVGNFKNAGRIWCQEAEQVNVYDFRSQAIGRAVPYGIYDLQHNQADVYVGQSADTAQFAVDTLERWCQNELPERFPGATHLFIEADGGGANSSRSHLFKKLIQDKIADGFGLIVTVCHYPPGASKWNPIEHRVFSEISKTWQGCPLRSFDLVLHYINQTKTQTGLSVQAHLVEALYNKGVTVAKTVLNTLNIQFHQTCPQWNYTISPRPRAIAS